MIVKSSQTFVWSSTACYRRAICWMYLWYLWRNEAVLFLHWHMVHYVSWHASSSPAPHQRSLQPTILHCRPGDAAANGCGDTAANVTFCIFFLRISEQSHRISTVLWLLWVLPCLFCCWQCCRGWSCSSRTSLWGRPSRAPRSAPCTASPCCCTPAPPAALLQHILLIHLINISWRRRNNHNMWPEKSLLFTVSGYY